MNDTNVCAKCAADMQARDEQLSAARRELDQASKLFVSFQENAISVLRERNALRAENARLIVALKRIDFNLGYDNDIVRTIVRAALEAARAEGEK